MKLLIQNGRVLDPATGRDGIYDVMIKNGKISEMAQNLDAEADRIVDA